MLFGEPPVLWDSFPAYAFREGLSIRVSRCKPPAREPKGYPNPVLEADRVADMARRMPGATHAEIGKVLGLSGNWVGDLLRISRLPDQITEYVRRFGPHLCRRQVVGLDLRRLVALRQQVLQLQRFDRLLRLRKLPPREYL